MLNFQLQNKNICYDFHLKTYTKLKFETILSFIKFHGAYFVTGRRIRVNGQSIRVTLFLIWMLLLVPRNPERGRIGELRYSIGRAPFGCFLSWKRWRRQQRGRNPQNALTENFIDSTLLSVNCRHSSAASPKCCGWNVGRICHREQSGKLSWKDTLLRV